MANYPTSLDSLVNPGASDYMDSVGHAQQHSDVNDAVEALEAKLGISASTPTSGKLLRGTGAGSSAWDKDAPTGTIVGTTDSQTLTNKTLTSPTLNTAIINNPTLKTDTIAEFTAAAGVTIDGLLIKDNKLATNNSVVTANITDDAVNDNKLDYPRWWQEIARGSLSVAGDTLTISSIPARKYLKVVWSALNSGAIISRIRFNNDSANNYAFQYILNNSGSNATNNAQLGDLSNGSFPNYGTMEIMNISSQPKQYAVTSVYAASAPGTAPNYIFFNGIWANTSAQITRIDLFNGGAGDFAAGTEMVVMGHD